MTRGLCLTGLLLLSATLGPGCTRKRWPDKSIARAKCKEYHDAALMWARFRGELPGSLADMNASIRPGESAFGEVIDDPWGRPYVLERTGDQARVRCVGPDGKAGTEDDVVYPE